MNSNASYQILQLEKQAEFITNFMDRALSSSTIYDGPHGTRDIDEECGYPKDITIHDYVTMFRRNEIANRVVCITPDECWKDYPKIYETEENRETPFEKAVDRLDADTHLFSYLHRFDVVSGIGRFGVILLGFDDGGDFSEPAPGFTDQGPTSERGSANVVYYRVFSELSVSISEFETDWSNKRYGQPLYYDLDFQEFPTGTEVSRVTRRVHWSRVVHVADNKIESEIYGAPRQEAVFNRLLDLRKVNAGASEMFWKGAFPGLSFEVDPKYGDFSEEDRKALKDEVRDYAEHLQRYITTVGVSVKSLAPQIVDSTPNIKNLLMLIAMNLGVPMQTFQGSQQGQLDSPQDAIVWRERIALRKERHVSPFIIRPVIDRLIQVGALPEPEPQLDSPLRYVVKWEPMAPLNIIEQAKVAKDFSEALARYSTSASEALMPFPEYLGKVMGFTPQQTEAVMAAAKTRFSLVFEQLEGLTGSAGGNAPSSIPKVPKPGNKKDPSKTPVNVQQKAK
jgi:hypothetical protein